MRRFSTVPFKGTKEQEAELVAWLEEHKATPGVLVTQTGCIGICQYEPVAEITCPGQEKVTYVKMTPEKVARVVSEHLVGGHPVTEYTIGNVR